MREREDRQVDVPGFGAARRAFPTGALVLAVGLALSSTATAFAVAEVLNRRTVELQVVQGVRYLALDVFQDALGLEGDQTLSGSYRLFGSPGQTADVVVEFSAGSPRILVNEKESVLKHAPIQGDGVLLVPYDEFVALFVPESAAAPREDAGPQNQTTLLDINHTRISETTVIYFKLSARPDYRFQFDGDTATLQVVFRHATRQFGQEEVELDTDEATKITLESMPEKATLVASIHLRQEVTYDSSFDDSTGQLILRLKGPGSVDAPATAGSDAAASDMQSYLSNHVIVIDAGHGGDDPGVQGTNGRGEAALALDLALRLKPVLEKGGFKVSLTRNSAGGLTMQERLVAINGRRPAAVLSIHLNSSFDPEAQGTQTCVLKVPQVKDAQDPYGAKRGVFGPSAEEITSSHQLARKLMASISKLLKRRTELLEEELLLPAGRVFAPAVTLEVAYLTSPRERGLLEKRTSLERWTYAIYSGLYQHFLEKWRADGGQGPPVEKLPDAPAALPAPEKPAPPPAKIASSKGEQQVKSPESADALDGDDEENEEPAGPEVGGDRNYPGATLPRAAAVPLAPARAPPLPAAPAADQEEDDDEIAETIRQADSIGRPFTPRRPATTPSPRPGPPADVSVTQEED